MICAGFSVVVNRDNPISRWVAVWTSHSVGMVGE